MAQPEHLFAVCKNIPDGFADRVQIPIGPKVAVRPDILRKIYYHGVSRRG